jgi:hypothetical protein
VISIAIKPSAVALKVTSIGPISVERGAWAVIEGWQTLILLGGSVAMVRGLMFRIFYLWDVPL